MARLICTDMTRPVVTPRSVSSSRTKLLDSSRAPTSSTTDMAICAVTTAARSRRARRPSPPADAAIQPSGAGSARISGTAVSSPANRAAPIEIASAKRIIGRANAPPDVVRTHVHSGGAQLGRWPVDRSTEAGTQHADNRVLLAVDDHRAPHRGHVRAEPRPPQPVRDDRRGQPGIGQSPAHQQRVAEDLEERPGDGPAVERLVPRVAVQRGESALTQGQRLERTRPLGPVTQVEPREPEDRAPRPRVAHMNDDDGVRIRIRERPHQHAVHDAEDGGIDADPERQHADRHQTESRRAPQGPEHVRETLHQGVEPAPSPDGADILPDQRHVAERRTRRACSLLRWHPLLDVLSRLQIQVQVQLPLDVIFRPAAAVPRKETGDAMP